MKLRVAVLGPEFSHSQLAVSALGLGDAEISLTESISNSFRSLDTNQVDAVLVPIENLFHGPVLETLDGLMNLHFDDGEPKKDEDIPQIIHSFNYTIAHYIGLPEAARYELSDVEVVFSHEQALAQCDSYLSEHLPKAKREAVKSTSFAAKKVGSEERKSAVIASKEALEAYGCRVLSPITTFGRKNITRFALIARAKNAKRILGKGLPTADSFSASAAIPAAYLCVHPRRDRQGVLLEILEIVSRKMGCNLLSIHSRPDARGGFVFFLEIEDDICGRDVVFECVSLLREYGLDKTSETLVVRLIGRYQRESFSPNLIRSLAVVGAEGAMGQWFMNFFSQHGMKVVGVDLCSDEKTQSELSHCDAIVFSVPLGELPSAYKSIEKWIPKKCVLVDNSSIKGETLDFLCSNTSSEVEVLGLHTMFGPNQMDGALGNVLDDKNVVVSKTKKSSELSDAFESIFYKYGAKLVVADSEAHDKTVAYTQSLVHFLSMVFGLCLKESGMSSEELNGLSTPNYDRMKENLIRVLSQSSDLTIRIQNDNSHAAVMRDDAKQAVDALLGALEKGGLDEVLQGLRKEFLESEK